MPLFGAFGWWLACIVSLVCAAIAARLFVLSQRNIKETQVTLDEIKRREAWINMTCKSGHRSSHALTEVMRRGSAACPSCGVVVLTTRAPVEGEWGHGTS